MLVKCVIMLKALMVLTSHAGAHSPSRFVTGDQPARIRNSSKTTERIKLTTWLRVSAEVMVLTSHAGAHSPSRFVTGDQPARIRNSSKTTERIKLTTWLRVSAEVMALTARYAPAINRLPM